MATPGVTGYTRSHRSWPAAHFSSISQRRFHNGLFNHYSRSSRKVKVKPRPADPTNETNGYWIRVNQNSKNVSGDNDTLIKKGKTHVSNITSL